MNITFENKVALVTGAASGLGLATAKAFAEAGASVVLADWSEKEVKGAAKELADKGHKMLAVTCDVSDDAQVEAMVKKTVAEFGQLDAAYNNAGIQNVLAETADSPRDDYDLVMGVNLRGVWSCMKFELQVMRQQGSGAIVNCSSLGGLIGGARRGTYHVAKHGVIGFTKSAALEYATRGIRVNDVCPGMIQTPMSDKMIAEGQGPELEKMLQTFVPMKRLGRPEEIADAVLWLCSHRISAQGRGCHRSSLGVAEVTNCGRAAAVCSPSVRMNVSTRRPTGNWAPESSSTKVSKNFRSTRSVGSSVRTFFGPSNSLTRTTCPQTFCLP